MPKKKNPNQLILFKFISNKEFKLKNIKKRIEKNSKNSKNKKCIVNEKSYNKYAFLQFHLDGIGSRHIMHFYWLRFLLNNSFIQARHAKWPHGSMKRGWRFIKFLLHIGHPVDLLIRYLVHLFRKIGIL